MKSQPQFTQYQLISFMFKQHLRSEITQIQWWDFILNYNESVRSVVTYPILKAYNRLQEYCKKNTEKPKSMKTVKHCKMEYKVINPYSASTNTEVIEVLGKQYTIVTLPRPTNTVAELMCVFVDGVRYNSLAKFLKSIY